MADILVSRIRNKWVRRCVIVATYPIATVAAACVPIINFLILVLIEPQVCLFLSARRVWREPAAHTMETSDDCR